MWFSAGMFVRLKILLRNLEVGDDLKIKNHKSLGLKSPKLTKALEAKGFESQFVSLLMQALKPVSELELTNSTTDVIAQSDTIHFSSCQAPGHGMNRTREDAEAASSGQLYLAVKRTPQGFSYRTKVRRCVSPDGATTIGWYIEREYGHGRPTPFQFARLLQQAGEPAYDRLAFYNEDSRVAGYSCDVGVEVLIPSAELGYQDTFSSGPRQVLKFYTVGVAPTVGDFEIPLVRNPYRKRGILVEGLMTLLFGRRDERESARGPEECSLRRFLKVWRRESPHLEWGRHQRLVSGVYIRNPRHRVLYNIVEVNGREAATVYFQEDGRDMEALLFYNSCLRSWSVGSISPLVEVEALPCEGDEEEIPLEEE